MSARCATVEEKMAMSALRNVSQGLALACSTFMVATAAYADGPYPAPPGPGYFYAPGPRPIVWTGFYAGFHGGWAWGNSKVTDTNNFGTAGAGALTRNNLDGGLVGLQLGYNVQSGPVVFGIEGDVGFLGFNDDT